MYRVELIQYVVSVLYIKLCTNGELIYCLVRSVDISDCTSSIDLISWSIINIMNTRCYYDSSFIKLIVVFT